jgi:hypothetical protein
MKLSKQSEKKEQERAAREAFYDKHWRGMPEFVHDDPTPYQQILVSFKSAEDVQSFAKLNGYPKLSNRTRWVWWPSPEPYSGATTAYMGREQLKKAGVDVDKLAKRRQAPSRRSR